MGGGGARAERAGRRVVPPLRGSPAGMTTAHARPRTRTESPAELKGRTRRIIDRLSREFPNAHCALDHRNAFELVAATILSAQCTDARVNLVTPVLFKAFP